MKGVAQDHSWFRRQSQNSTPVLFSLNCTTSCHAECPVRLEQGLGQAHQNRRYDEWLTFGLAWEAQSEGGSFKNILTEQMPSEFYFISLLHSKHEVTNRPRSLTRA